MPDLKDLRDKREEILKAELFMLLHDVGKLHVGHQAKYIRDDKKGEYQHPLLGPPSTSGLNILLNLGRFSIQRKQFSLITIVKNHHRPSGYATGLAQQIDWLDSEYDREWVPSGPKYIQPSSTFLARYSAFGYATKISANLNNRNNAVNCCVPQDQLEKLLCGILRLPPGNFVSERRSLLTFIRLAFLQATGDTRFSVNDISLWDHSWSTAVLLKIFLAFHVLSNRSLPGLPRNTQKRKQTFRRIFAPQLLPLRIDGLAYLSQSNNVPDLLARRALLQKVYDAWQDILEWEFPLAGEIYRDESGPVFLTFLHLQDQNEEHSISLKALQLPIEQSSQGNRNRNVHVLPEVYKQANNLEEYLHHAIVHLTQGDLTLRPGLELHPYTQKRSEDGKSLGDLLREEQKEGLRYQPDVKKIAQAWSNEGEQREKCSVCGLRPLGYGAQKTENKNKAISRGMCGVCLERRESRAKPWVQGIHLDAKERFLQGHPETVWLDEVADKHGRIALIVGYFLLEDWLDGTLVESLAMFKDKRRVQLNASNRQISLPQNRKPVLGPKPVSYSRIRRVWETTRRFWQDVAPTDTPPEELQKLLQGNKYGLKLEDLWEGPLSLKDSLAGQAIIEERSRIFLKGTPDPQNALASYHAYELEIQGRKVAVLWVPEKDAEVDLPEKYRGGFWVIENLDYLDNVYGRSFRDLVHELAGQPLKVYEPTEYGRPGQEQATFTIARDDGVQDDVSPYIPLIPILAEPRTFMALVPADKAFDVVKAIKAKYEREMGRVRNRLPLHLGIIFADAHQPLRTILDAGRRMLQQRAKPLVWEVMCSARKQINKGDTLPARFEVDRKGQFTEWVEVTLRNGAHQVVWYVPAVMGDGQTEDHWYPYVFLASPDEPTDRTRYYKTDLGNPWNPGHPWLVHAGELKPGDRIYFTPATFDFIFLDHGGRRFEIAYDKDGRRRGTLHRPYLLDEIEDLEACWRLLAGEKRQINGREEPIRRLSSRQLHQVRDLIETKRAEWFEKTEDSLQDETFRRFCVDVLQNAEGMTRPTEQELQRLTQWATSGLLADAVELFYHIMKQRPEGEFYGDTENPEK